MEIGILIGQFLALDLCPDHERVHRATYPLLLEAPLSGAAGMAHLHSRGNRRDARLVFQRWAGGQPGHVLEPLLRRAGQHARYLVSGNDAFRETLVDVRRLFTRRRVCFKNVKIISLHANSKRRGATMRRARGRRLKYENVN